MIYNTQDICNILSALYGVGKDIYGSSNVYGDTDMRRVFGAGYKAALDAVARAFNVEGMTPLDEVIDGECTLLAGEPSA